MKKLLIVLLIMTMAFVMTSVCYAGEIDFDVVELEAYISEKIVPVVAGVLTSIVALMTLLRSIAKSLKGLKDTKNAFETEAEKREISFQSNRELLENKAQEIKEIVNDVPSIQRQISQLEGNVDTLIKECEVLAKIMSLGFSANSEIVKSGKGKKMSLLIESLNKNEEAVKEAELNEEN